MFFDKSCSGTYAGKSFKKSIDNMSYSTSSFVDTISNLEKPSTNDRTKNLFNQFLTIFQSRANDSEIFETVQELVNTIDEILNELKLENEETNTSVGCEWLRKEQDTWKLLHALYTDRILIQKSETEEDIVPLGSSEKTIVSQLYLNNSNLREYQLIVDWLEACAEEKNTVVIGHFTDRKVGWENTLYQIKNPVSIAFTMNQDIISKMDPDAPKREKKNLHSLDIEDDLRLLRVIFSKIRQGKIEEAKSLCVYSGQPWRAATLEGWRLYEDSNDSEIQTKSSHIIDGNFRRDLWKKVAFSIADSPSYDNFTRAIYGSLCGHLESLLNVLHDSWPDLLWAYMKVQIDIKVETEIRSCCMKNYVEMPEKYWSSKISLEQIFQELSVHKNPEVRNQANHRMSITQKYLIMDNINELLICIRLWVSEENIPSQILRFFAHLVLVLKEIGRINRDNDANFIIKKYVESLIVMKNQQLVSYYASVLPSDLQIQLYSKFLEGIKNTQDRFEALEEAFLVGLNVEAITTYTVEKIRNIEQPYSDLLKGQISELEELKISSLEWLTFYPQQRAELLYQANSMIRTFLAEGKIECVRKTINIIPKDTIDLILSNFGNNKISPREECSIKEYLCYQTYLQAIDGFNTWTYLYHSKPKELEAVKSNVRFTEKMAIEHKEQIYRAELTRWNNSLKEQTKVTRDLLFNVLLFPDKGWLTDPEVDKETIDNIHEWKLREVQMESLKKLCIPEIVLLLLKVLHFSNDYMHCLKLADEIASERRQIYKVYSKHKLAELLSKISESSLALINGKFDPWGYKINI